MLLPKKISALPGVSTIKNADLFAIVQDGVTSNVTFAILESIISALTGTFTGNTSGDCITDLWVDNVYGCSPITMHNTMVFENADESLQYTGGTKLHFIRFDTDFDTLLTPIGNSVVVGAIPDSNSAEPSGSYMVLSEDRIIKLVIDSGATASDVLVIGDTTLSDVTQEIGTYDGNSFKNVGTLLNVSDSIIGSDTTLSSIISSENSQIINNSQECFLGGGMNNIINYSTSAVILGGTNHSILSGNSSIILGGNNNDIQARPGSDLGQASILGGSGNCIIDTTSDSDRSFIIGGINNDINNSVDSIMLGTALSDIINSSFGGFILGGNNLLVDSSNYSGMIGGNGNVINNADRSVVLGGQNITGTTDDTVYVPNLNIGTVGGGTPINNLGIDSIGNVVDSGVSIQEAKLVILSGDVLQLFTTPQQIIAAPGSGKIIDVIDVVGKIDYGTTDYTGTTLALKFTGASDNMVQESIFSPFLSMSISAIKKINVQNATATTTQIIENESLYVTVNTVDPANGDSTITIYVTYRILTL